MTGRIAMTGRRAGAAAQAASNTSRAQSWQQPQPLATRVSSCKVSKSRTPASTARRMSRSLTRWQRQTIMVAGRTSGLPPLYRMRIVLSHIPPIFPGLGSGSASRIVAVAHLRLQVVLLADLAGEAELGVEGVDMLRGLCQGVF